MGQDKYLEMVALGTAIWQFHFDKEEQDDIDDIDSMAGLSMLDIIPEES